MIESAKLKNYFLLAVLCILFSCTENPPKDTEESVLVHEDTLPLSPPSDQKVKPKLTNFQEIQHAYSTISADYENGKLDSISFKYNCNGETSGTVTYFSEQGNLKMITHIYAEYDHNEKEDRYFIKDGIPFFVHLKNLSWSFDSGPEGATKDKITEQRIYLSNWKAIERLEKKYEIRLHAGINPKPSDVANKQTNCADVQPMEKSYRLLAKYWKASAPKCLAE